MDNVSKTENDGKAHDIYLEKRIFCKTIKIPSVNGDNKSVIFIKNRASRMHSITFFRETSGKSGCTQYMLP